MQSSITLVSPEGVRVVEGGNILVFEPGVAREVPAHLVLACRKHGCFPPNGLAGLTGMSEGEAENAGVVGEPGDDPTVHALADAIEEIMDLGSPQLLTSSGVPRAAELKKRVPEYTPEQLTAALALTAERAAKAAAEATGSTEEPETTTE